jgi:uncharacterized membrane protein YagU involved in acid resistance
VAVAGAAGGAAEVLWIGLAAAVLGAEGWQISRAVTATVIATPVESAFAPGFGLVIHFALSFVLAVVFARTVARRLRGAALFAAAAAALGFVWALNFLVLVPVFNPAFTALLPHPVTLISKLLFGAGMAAALNWSAASSGGSPVSNAVPRR